MDAAILWAIPHPERAEEIEAVVEPTAGAEPGSPAPPRRGAPLKIRSRAVLAGAYPVPYGTGI